MPEAPRSAQWGPAGRTASNTLSLLVRGRGGGPATTRDPGRLSDSRGPSLLNLSRRMDDVDGCVGAVRSAERSVWRPESPPRLCPPMTQMWLNPQCAQQGPRPHACQRVPRGPSARVFEDSRPGQAQASGSPSHSLVSPAPSQLTLTPPPSAPGWHIGFPVPVGTQESIRWIVNPRKGPGMVR